MGRVDRRPLLRVLAGVPLVAAVPGRAAAAASTAELDHVAAGSSQVVVVATKALSSTRGYLAAWQHDATGTWRRALGPWAAWVGRTGLAPAGTKHEGDGRTPVGSFPVPFLFGAKPLPGVHLRYRRVTGPWDRWCDVPGDPHYNQWVDTRHVHAKATESLPRYDYAAVIGYNRHPVVQGAGSAIFLHQTRGTPTIGCVSLPIPQLVQVLRWFEPGAAPRIAIGVAGSLTRVSVAK